MSRICANYLRVAELLVNSRCGGWLAAGQLGAAGQLQVQRVVSCWSARSCWSTPGAEGG